MLKQEDAKFESSPVLFPVPTKEPENSCPSGKRSTLALMLVMTTCQFDGEQIFLPIEDQMAIERLQRSGFNLSAASWQTVGWSLVVSFNELPGHWFDFKLLRQPQCD